MCVKLNVFLYIKSVNPYLGVFFLLTQTNEEQQAKIEELQDKLDKVLTIALISEIA